MAQTGYTPIKLYYSTTADATPSAGNLANGELAINITDGKLYYKDNGGNIKLLANSAIGQLTLPISAANGGTGQSSYTTGDILYASGSTALSKLGLGTSGYVLTAGSSAPAYVAQSTLSVGTAANIAGGSAGALAYNSASGTTTFLSLGTTNYVLTAGASAPQYVAQSTLSVGSATTATSAATATNIAGGANGSLPYQTGSGSTTFLAAGTNGQVLTLAGGVPTWANDTQVSSFSAGTTGFTPNTETTGAVTLAGTLNVANGGTGLTSLTANYIPYGNGTSAFSSSANLSYNGSTLVVGPTSLAGTVNPITAFTGSANNYVQTYIFNTNTGVSASADFVAYANNSSDAHGWADMGFTGSNYADTTYTVTGPNEAYLFGSALNSTYTGNLVYATDSTGSANAHQWYVGGFTQAKSAWKMQLTSGGLQLASALGTSSGGTGLSSFTAGGAVYASSTSALTTGTLPTTGGGTGLSSFTSGGAVYASSTSVLTTGTLPIASGGTGLSSTPANGALDIGNGTGFTRTTLTAGSGISITNGSGTITIAASGGTAVTSVTGTAPIVSSGGTTPAISITQANTSTNGYLSATDWNTFNGKLSTAVTSAVAGTGVSVSGATGAVTFSIGQAVATSSNVQFNSLGVGTAASTTAGEIRATNNVTAYYSSDRKLKENIKDVDNALNIVYAIGTKTFDWTDEYIVSRGGEDGYFVQKSDFGVIAQDVQAVFPQAVRTREDGTLAVDYEKLSTLAFGAIKELLKRVEALESK